MRAVPPVYPFLFAYGPILGLFADNYFEVPWLDLARPLAVATVITPPDAPMASIWCLRANGLENTLVAKLGSSLSGSSFT